MNTKRSDPQPKPLQTTHLELRCVSCEDHVDQLSCLPCLHSLGVCDKKECRQKLMERGVFCPHCKKKSNIPAEGFPRYSFAERQAAAKKMEEEGTFCYAEHNTPQEAVVFCSDCPGPLCEECYSGHRTMAFSKKHRIVSLQDTMKAGLASQHRPLLCPTHKKEVECFCQDCEVLICTVCPVVGPHQSHRVLFVDEEVGERNRQPFEQCVRSAEKRIEEMSSAVKGIDFRLLTLHEEHNHCKENIVDLKEHIIEVVNRRSAVLVAEVEEAEEKKRKDLEQHKKAFEAQIKQLQTFKTPVMEIFQEGTTREQLSLRQAVIQRASSLTSIPPPPAPPSSSSVFFVSEKKEEAKKILSVIGHVSWGPAPEASSIYMEGRLFIVDNTVQCRPWGQPLNLRVVSRDCRGVECGRGGERVESVLTPTSCGVPVQGEVKDRGDGTYQVTFRCLPSEECRLSVALNGRDVKGSPVRVKLSHHSIIKRKIMSREKARFFALVYTKEGTLLATGGAVSGGNHVCNFTKSGELLSSFKVLNTGINFLPGLAVLTDSNIAVSVIHRKCVEVYRPNGELVRKEFASDRLNRPCGLAVNHRGQLFVADRGHHRVCVFTENGDFQYSFGCKGSGPGQFNAPDQICFSQNGLVYISDSQNHRIQVFQQDGHFVQQFGQGILNEPIGLALTKDGHIVVASRGANKLSIFTQSGECMHEVKEIGLNIPDGVAIADDGSIFVADRGNCRIVQL